MKRPEVLGLCAAVVIALLVSKCAHAGNSQHKAALRASLNAQESALFRLCRDMIPGKARKQCEANYAAFVDKRYPVKRRKIT